MNPVELRRFHSGDRSLFRRLVEGESPRLLRYATWLCGDAQDAQDLVQETWIAAYEQRATFMGRSPLLSWLTAICRSRFLSSHRTTGRRKQLLVRHSSYLAETGSCSSASEADPLARRRMAEALGQLPERQRDVIVLRLVEGLSTKETAERLGVAEGTIKSSLARGLSGLRALLEDCQS